MSILLLVQLLKPAHARLLVLRQASNIIVKKNRTLNHATGPSHDLIIDSLSQVAAESVEYHQTHAPYVKARSTSIQQASKGVVHAWLTSFTARSRAAWAAATLAEASALCVTSTSFSAMAARSWSSSLAAFLAASAAASSASSCSLAALAAAADAACMRWHVRQCYDVAVKPT